MGHEPDHITLDHYKRFLASSGACKSELAIRDYLLSLDMFCRVLEGPIFETVTDYRSFHWTIEDLAARTTWPDGRSKKRWGARTIYKVATECIVFFRWALAFRFTGNKVFLDDPIVGHLFQKGTEKEPEFFDWTDRDLKRLLYDPSNTVRKKAIYHTLRASGMRPGECAALKREDALINEGVVRIQRRKGGKAGFAPLDQEAISALKEYLECLAFHYDGPWLFPLEDYSGPVTGHGIWKMMYNHGKKLGVHFYPYRLRHSVPAELAERGLDALTISEVMGHKDPRTTRIYFHLSKQKIKKIYSIQKIQSA